MKFLSILRKKFGLRKDTLNNEYGEVKSEELSQVSMSEGKLTSIETMAFDDDHVYIKDDSQLESFETQNELLTKNFNKMLSTKSELLKEGREIMELIHNYGNELNTFLSRKENESDEELENRRAQRELLIDRYDDWIEYARLYIYKNQIIPTHYDEFMTPYSARNRNPVWYIKKTLRIIETCK